MNRKRMPGISNQRDWNFMCRRIVLETGVSYQRTRSMNALYDKKI